MKAIVIREHGGPEVLELREVPDPPAPSRGYVRVRVRATALNRADVLQRMGKYPPPPGFPADIPGMEFSGEIESVGETVFRWKVGDRVFGITGGGSYAEYLLTPANHIARIPDNLNWTDAAAIPEAFITAHDAMFTQAHLQPGETVLIHAVGSGVGLAGAQLAHAAGATVIGTSRTEDKLVRAAENGLDHGICTKDGSPDFDVRVSELTGGVNVVLDLVGGPMFERNIKSLVTKGRLILIGTTAGASASLNYGQIMAKRLTIKGTVLRAR
jgi:NADPH2:quinone reductase